jgi:hypothetical protein
VRSRLELSVFFIRKHEIFNNFPLKINLELTCLSRTVKQNNVRHKTVSPYRTEIRRHLVSALKPQQPIEISLPMNDRFCCVKNADMVLKIKNHEVQQNDKSRGLQGVRCKGSR